MKFDTSVYTLSLTDFSKYANKVKNTPSLSKLVTFSPNQKLPRHRWFHYKESFSADLVDYLLQKLKSKKEQGIILDPFCGIGTTLLTSKTLGYDSMGIDILPMCTFISETKLRNYENISEIENILLNIKGDSKKQMPYPERYYLTKSFHKNQLMKLTNLRYEISKIDNKNARDLARLALLSILLDTSTAIRDGGFLRFKNQKVPKNIKNTFHKKISQIIWDLKQLKLSKKAKSTVVMGDARTHELEKKFSTVITSPPYLNRYDYTRRYALELTFEFLNDQELTELRYNTLKSHTESRSTSITAPSSILENNLEQLSKRELTNTQIPEMIHGYYADLYATLENISNYARDNARLAFVVSTSRFSGIHFEADVIITDLAEKLGYKLENILITKLRGSSAQQCKKYGEIPLRESIVILKR